MVLQPSDCLILFFLNKYHILLLHSFLDGTDQFLNKAICISVLFRHKSFNWQFEKN